MGIIKDSMLSLVCAPILAILAMLHFGDTLATIGEHLSLAHEEMRLDKQEYNARLCGCTEVYEYTP